MQSMWFALLHTLLCVSQQMNYIPAHSQGRSDPMVTARQALITYDRVRDLAFYYIEEDIYFLTYGISNDIIKSCCPTPFLFV